MNLPHNFKVLSKDLCKKIDFDMEAQLLKTELDRATKENDIQSYIKRNEKWFIPLSILKDYDFGHHFACVVPEYSLGAEYKMDYLLIGKNSLGYHYIFVEFEDVNVEFKLKTSNTESYEVRKGIAQIRDWKMWIDRHKEYFEKSEGISEFDRNIPKWAFNYCLVVGRRGKMDDASNLLRGQIQSENLDLKIITYDRLIDNVGLMSNGI